jgi:hypothetical protein
MSINFADFLEEFSASYSERKKIVVSFPRNSVETLKHHIKIYVWYKININNTAISSLVQNSVNVISLLMYFTEDRVSIFSIADSEIDFLSLP